MANSTGIEWTDASSNPVRYRAKATGRDVWACVKRSPGCAHCYSEAMARRFGRGGPFTKAVTAGVEPYLCETECGRLLRSKKLAGRRVFLGDMTDVFGEWVPDGLLDRLFSGVLEVRTDVTFQVLTKRADRMREYLSWRWGGGRIPARNVWCGASVEDQQRADERIPELLKTPAAVRFLSVEPLIGPVDLARLCLPDRSGWWNALDGRLTVKATSDAGQEFWAETEKPITGRIGWVIVGGESGPGARPFQLDWARAIQAQCDAAGVPWFFKQAGSNARDWTRGDPPNHEPPELVPLRLRDRKGGDLEELPASLRVREFPGEG